MLLKCRGELSTSGFFPFSVWFTSVKAADGGGWIWPTTTINTHQDAESCSTHTLAQVLRAAGGVPQNYRRESSTGPIAEPDGTSSIHQNHKYSSHWLQPQGFQGDHRIWWCHFFFTFSEYYGITPSFWLVLPSYWWCRRARWQVWKLHPVALILTSVSFKKQQKKRHASIRIRWSKKCQLRYDKLFRIDLI